MQTMGCLGGSVSSASNSISAQVQLLISHCSWDQAPHWVPVLTAWSLLGILSLPLSPPLPNLCSRSLSCSLALSLSKINFLKLFLSFYLFIVDREKEREREGEGQRERDRERIPSRLCTVSTEPNAGLKLTNIEIMTWAKTKSQMLSQLNHLDASINKLFLKRCKPWQY